MTGDQLRSQKGDAMTTMPDEAALQTLRQLARNHTDGGAGVHAPGYCLRHLMPSGETIPIDEYIVHEGWARKIWNERGELNGLQITLEGTAWLAELERQMSEYLARR